MKKRMIALLLGLLLITAGCSQAPDAVPSTVPTTAETMAPTTLPEIVPTEAETLPPETVAPTTESTVPPLELTDEEKILLLKIGMAELGDTECTECIALVMRTILNRVASDRFPGTVYGVLYAEGQFTPVGDGSFDAAVPNDSCCEALELVISGWDESQGALFYEFCEGESWHSKNLELLVEHCNTRFYR